MEIREARPGELPAIMALIGDDDLARERGSAGLGPAVESAFDEILASDRDLLVVGVSDGEVVACLQLTFVRYLTYGGRERAMIEYVRVGAGHQGRGLGRQLMAWAIERARERGCHLVQLTTDRRREDAHRFYEDLGFRPTHLGMKLDLREHG